MVKQSVCVTLDAELIQALKDTGKALSPSLNKFLANYLLEQKPELSAEELRANQLIEGGKEQAKREQVNRLYEEYKEKYKDKTKDQLIILYNLLNKNKYSEQNELKIIALKKLIAEK